MTPRKELMEACLEHLSEIRNGPPVRLSATFELKCPACEQVYPKDREQCPKCRQDLVANPKFSPSVKPS